MEGGLPLSPLLGISGVSTTAGREQRAIAPELLRGLADGTLLKGTIEEARPDGLVMLKTHLGTLQFKVELSLLRHLARGQEMLLRVVQQPGQDLPAVRPLSLDHVPIGQLTRPGHSPEATLTGQLAGSVTQTEQRRPEGYNHLRPLTPAGQAQPAGQPSSPRPPVGTLIAAGLTQSSDSQQAFRRQIQHLLSGNNALLAGETTPARPSTLPTAFAASPATPLPGQALPGAPPPPGGVHPNLLPGGTASAAPSPTVPGAASLATPTIPASSPPPSTPAMPPTLLPPMEGAGTGTLPAAPPASQPVSPLPATALPAGQGTWLIRIISYGAPTPVAPPAPPAVAASPPPMAADAFLPPDFDPLQPPPAPSSGPASSPAPTPPLLTPGTPLLPGQALMLSPPVMEGRVTLHPATGQPLLNTPAGQFALPPHLQLQEGEILQVTLEALAPPGPPAATDRLPRWASMEQLMQLITQHFPLMIPLLDSRMPRPNLQLSNTTLLFLTALKGGNPLSLWLGEESIEQLAQRQEFHPVLQRLQGELQQLAQSPAPTPDQPWQVQLLPLWTQGGEIRPLILLQHREGRQQHADGTESRHFLLELEFHHTGPLQLEGLWRAPLRPESSGLPKQFSLTFTSLRPLPDAMRQEMKSLYSRLMDGFELSGQLRFETVDAFETDTALHLALENLAGLWHR